VIPVTVDEIAMALGGQLFPAQGAGSPRDRHSSGDQAAVITALTADSRTVIPGALFVALRGERVDGHDYVATAAAAGAAASLTRRPVAGALCLVVADPLVALGRLSRYLVDRANYRSSVLLVQSARPRPRTSWRKFWKRRVLRSRRPAISTTSSACL
jgi:UDP-N-acetylmuramoyl-tripeptide--D-alanyl-D-alanine ligase